MRLRLQLPESPLRAHYVKARVRVLDYPDGTLAVFHGPRKIARYDAHGQEIVAVPIARSLTPCSPPSRRGLARQEQAAAKPQRPALTAPAHGVERQAQVGTKKRSTGRTKKPATVPPPRTPARPSAIPAQQETIPTRRRAAKPTREPTQAPA